jgi:hypothetical protein
MTFNAQQPGPGGLSNVAGNVVGTGEVADSHFATRREGAPSPARGNECQDLGR